MNYLLFALLCAGIFSATAIDPKHNVKEVAIWAVVLFLAIWWISYLFSPSLGMKFHYPYIMIAISTLCGAFLHVESTYNTNSVIRFAPFGVMVFGFLVMFFSSDAILHSKDYYQRLDVKELPADDFSQKILPTSLSKMITVDENLARSVAGTTLSEIRGVGSRCEIGKLTMTELTATINYGDGQTVTFENDLVWVAPLEHSGWLKWINNDVTPGYIIVDATNFENKYFITELDGKPLKLRYLEDAYFGDELKRHIRSNGYALNGLTDYSFEIDNFGRPFWVVTLFEKSIGFFGAEATGVLIVDPQTGSIEECSIENAPSWVSRIQPADFVFRQVNDWGRFKNGWLASLSGNEVLKATPGMQIVFANERSYFYTGIQSYGIDDATTGIMLIDTKTKEATLYQMPNSYTEGVAMSIANAQQPFASAGQTANFPIIYNVKGQESYFMTMKGEGQIVGYCFVAVNNRKLVGSGVTIQEAERNYLRSMQQLNQYQLNDSDIMQVEKVYTVKDIAFENDTYYVLFNESEVSGVEFYGSIELREFKWSKSGDRVKITYISSPDSQVSLKSFDNLEVELK